MSEINELSNNKKQDHQETTPSPNIDHKLFVKITPDLKHRQFRNATSTPLKTIQENVKVDGSKTNFNENNHIIRNPFDVKAEALYFPSCSPSLFASFARKPENETNFRWSIEQLSELFPADIDETSVQDVWMDPENEMKAQKAIDAFFSQKHIVPSPWSSSSQGISPCTSNQRHKLIKLRRNLQEEDKKSSNEISTQTTLSIPPHVDLRAILGEYFTFNDEQEQSNSRENSCTDADILSSSSLRRRLFVAEEVEDNPDISRPDIDDENLDDEFKTPEVNMQNKYSKRSSDLFSSSPKTPCRFNGTVSTPSISPPTVSPITSSFRNATSAYRERLTTDAIITDEAMTRSNSCVEWMQEDTCQSMMSIVPENSEVMAEPTELESQNNLMSLCSRWISDQQDTGYLTGSTNLAQSQSLSAVASSSLSRITPVSELMSDCGISKLNCGNFHLVPSNEESALFSLGNMKYHDGKVSSSENWPWIPNESSTPTKS